MDLNDIIPYKYRQSNDCKWTVSGKFLRYRHFENIPVAYIKDDYVYVLLDARISKKIVEVIKHLIKLNVCFFFTSPKISNPRGIEDFTNETIRHCLYSYANKNFYHQFKKIPDFDFIKILVKWCIINDCVDEIKNNFDYISEIVSRNFYDYYSKSYLNEYDSEIREEFISLWREIQINMIL